MPASSNGHIRTEQQMEADLVLVSRYYLRGFTYDEMSQRIEEIRGYRLSVASISRAVATLRERWLESQLINFDQAQARELQRIDQLEQAYWEAFDRSIRDAEEVTTEVVDDTYTGSSDGKSGYARQKTTRKKSGRDGSSEFLKGIERCIEKRCKILGLFSPTKHQYEVDWRTQAIESGVPESEINRQFEDLVNAYAAAGKGTGMAKGNGTGSLEGGHSETEEPGE